MVVVMSLCPFAKSSCAGNDDELTAKIAAILTETGSENQQNLELSGDKVQDAKKVQKTNLFVFGMCDVDLFCGRCRRQQ